MFLPKLVAAVPRKKTETVAFRGLNFSDHYREGDFADCFNITTENYPYLSTRRKRMKVSGYEGADNIAVFGDKILSTEGTRFLINGEEKGTVKAVGAGERQFVFISGRVCIFPDNVVYNFSEETMEDLHSRIEYEDSGESAVMSYQTAYSGAIGSRKITKSITGIVMSWNAHNVINETINHIAKDKIARLAIHNLPDIVKNAILFDTNVSTPTSNGKTSGSKMKNTAFMHGFYCIYEYGGKQYLLRLLAEQALSNNGSEVFTRAYELKDIEKIADLANGVSDDKSSLSDAKSATVK